MSPDVDVDVLVVGAGPTGLTLAHELGLAGVRVTVLERAAERAGQSKALNLQPRSAEVFDLRGLLAPLLERSIALLRDGHFAGLPVSLDYGLWPTRHPYQVGIPQARVEALLEERLPALGPRLLRGHEALTLRQDADGVMVDVRRADGASGQIRAAYVVGCDGARSVVRTQAGIDFPGQPGRARMVVADARLARTPPGLAAAWDSTRSFWRFARWHAGGFASIFPLEDGVCRLLFGGPRQQRVELTAPVTDQETREALAEAYQGEVELGELLWASRFTDASRQADRYQAGRVFVAGDAAHIHLPAGGQGLNLGVQDAFNLGWKLAAAVRGQAPAGLLGSYHAERHPVGARVLANTKAQGVLSPANADAVALRELMAELMELPAVNRRLAGMVSGLDVRYDLPGGHPLVGAFLPDLDLAATDGAGPSRVGELLRDGRAVVLELTGGQDYAEAAAPWRPRVRHVAAVGGGPHDPAALAIRPDGHVCWAVDRGADRAGEDPREGLAAALGHWFGQPAR